MLNQENQSMTRIAAMYVEYPDERVRIIQESKDFPQDQRFWLFLYIRLYLWVGVPDKWRRSL